MQRDTVLGFLAGAATMYVLSSMGGTGSTGSPWGGTYSRYGTQGTGFGIAGGTGTGFAPYLVGLAPTTLSRYTRQRR